MKVYFIGCKNRIKIGVSRNPKSRLKSLQTANPYKLRLLYEVECKSRDHAYGVEYQLHGRYFSKKARGEWFDNLPLSEAIQAAKRLSHDDSVIRDRIEDGESLDAFLDECHIERVREKLG